MAVKKKVKMKRAPAGKSMEEIQAMMAEDYMTGPITPEQQAEMESLQGENAAAMAMNEALPERRVLQGSTAEFKSKVSASEFEALKERKKKKVRMNRGL